MEFAVYTISIKGFFLKYYEIYRDDELIYSVRKPSFFAFRELFFTDPLGNEILKIYRVSSFFLYKFIISQHGDPIATVKKDRMSNFYDSSGIYGNHTIQGDFFSTEFTIFDENDEIAKISRKRLRSNKKYGVAIIKGNDELYILALVIIISIVNSRGKKKG